MNIKIKNRYIAAILLFLSICIISIILTIHNKDQEHSQNELQENIQEDTYDNFTIKIDDIDKVLNNELSGYIYIGRDTCPLCLYLNKFIKKEFNTSASLNIFKFDTDYWRSNDNFQNVLDKYNVRDIPALIKVNEDNSFTTFSLDVNDNEELEDSEVEKQLSVFLKN